MAILIGLLLACVFLALEWIVRAALLTPLPGNVQCVFHLDDETEPELEACVRGYRFLKRHGMIRGALILELGDASGHTRRAAALLARRGDSTVRGKEE